MRSQTCCLVPPEKYMHNILKCTPNHQHVSPIHIYENKFASALKMRAIKTEISRKLPYYLQSHTDAVMEVTFYFWEQKRLRAAMSVFVAGKMPVWSSYCVLGADCKNMLHNSRDSESLKCCINIIICYERCFTAHKQLKLLLDCLLNACGMELYI